MHTHPPEEKLSLTVFTWALVSRFMRLILVLIIFGVLTCTQRNLDIHLPGYMINIRTLVSHDLFAQVPVMFIFLQHKQFFKIQEK